MMDLPPPPQVPNDAPQEVVYELEQKTPLTRECLDRVVQRYDVHPLVLTLIATVEGGWAGARIENTNSTVDLGLMQINSLHVKELSNYGITERMLQNNECISLGVAAWYVRRVTDGITLKEPEDYFRAIARYHSKNEPYLTIYADKLMDAYEKLIDQYGVSYGQ